MSRTPIIAGVVGIAVLLCVTILFTVPRPSPPPIRVRHVRSIQSGRWFSATFGITNPPIWLGRVNRIQYDQFAHRFSIAVENVFPQGIGWSGTAFYAV